MGRDFFMSSVKIPMLWLYSRKENRIQFHREKNLAEVKLSHPVGPHNPGELSTLSGNTLLYTNTSKSPSEIHLLNCKSKTPKQVKSIITQQSSVAEMCCLETHGKDMLVYINYYGIYTYNIQSGTVGDWSASGRLTRMEDNMRPCGLTTDDIEVICLYLIPNLAQYMCSPWMVDIWVF